jgi:hypothetical protein
LSGHSGFAYFLQKNCPRLHAIVIARPVDRYGQIAAIS